MLSSFIFCLVVQQSANATHDGKLPRIFSHGHHKVITGFPFGLLVILCTVTLPFQQKTLSAMFSFCASSLSSCHFQFNCKFHLYHTGRQHFTSLQDWRNCFRFLLQNKKYLHSLLLKHSFSTHAATLRNLFSHVKYMFLQRQVEQGGFNLQLGRTTCPTHLSESVRQPSCKL